MQSFILDPNETPEQAAMRRKQMLAQALMAPQPSGIGDGLASLGNAVAYRGQQQNAAFPTAPDAAKPDWLTSMHNLFSGGSNGGLF